MALITRQGKGSKLTIQEMDGNLTYLRDLANGQEKIEEMDNLSRSELLVYELPEDTEFTGGVFKSEYDVPQFFMLLGSGDQLNNVETWNKGPILVEGVEGIFNGYKVVANLQGEGDNVVTISQISGFKLPDNFDLPFFGNVDVLKFVSADSVSVILKSVFFDVRYEWNNEGDGEWLHLMYLQFGAYVTVMLEVEGNQNEIINLDLRFL